MRAIKFYAASQIKQRPALMAKIWGALPYLPFLLPHDRSYYGLRHLGRADGLFLDIGANNGVSALGFRKIVGPEPRIFSIEANPAHRPALERIKRHDRCFDYRIIGLGRENARFTLWTPYSGRTALTALSSGHLDYAKAVAARDYGPAAAARLRYEPTEVRVTTLDSLGLAPSIIKIDVEGLDFDVLQGGERVIDSCRPAILLEYTPAVSGPMLDWLRAKGYHCHVYRHDRDAFEPFDQGACDRAWANEHLQINVFALPRG
jgi:FkbM family methyltransferase